MRHLRILLATVFAAVTLVGVASAPAPANSHSEIWFNDCCMAGSADLNSSNHTFSIRVTPGTRSITLVYFVNDGGLRSYTTYGYGPWEIYDEFTVSASAGSSISYGLCYERWLDGRRYR